MKKVALITLVWVAMAVIVVGIIIFNRLLNVEQAPPVVTYGGEGSDMVVKNNKTTVDEFLQMKAVQIEYNKANPKTFTKGIQ